MRSMMAAVLLVAAAPLMAQAHGVTASCADISMRNLPEKLAGWGKQPAMERAGATAAEAPLVMPGAKMELTLLPATLVTLAHPPGQQRTADAPHAGIIAVDVPADGIWLIAASKPVWIDVLAGGHPVEALKFGNLAPCTSIRKVVEFPLKAGRHLVQLSGNPGSVVEIMISSER